MNIKNALRKLALLGTACVMLTAVGIAASADSTIEKPKQVVLGQQTSSVLTYRGSDVYVINLQESSCLTIDAESDIRRVYTKLYDASKKNVLYEGTDKVNDLGRAITHKVYYLTSGTYYFMLMDDYESWWEDSDKYTRQYNITISAVSANETFKEGQGGNNNTSAAANDVDFGKEYKGQIAGNDECDFFKFKIAESGKVNFAGMANFTIHMNLYGNDGNSLYSGKWNPNNLGNAIYNQDWYLTAGDYYIKIFFDGWDNVNKGNYSFTLTNTPAGESFKETYPNTDNEYTKANPVDFGQTYTGQIGKNDSKDFYKIVMSVNGDVDVSFTGIDVEFNLYDDKGNHQKKYYVREGYRSVELTLDAGTYYFDVSDRDGIHGVYGFSMCNHEYAARVSVASAGKNGSKYNECVKCHKKTAEEVIYAPASISVDTSKQIKYNGKAKKPAITVYDSNGTIIEKKHYKVSYKNNKNPGLGTVIVKFNSGDYSGSLKQTFVIQPSAPKITSVARTGRFEITAKWKKIPGVGGYNIKVTRDYYYATINKNAGKKATSAKIKVPFRKRTYNVYIRSYKKIKGQTYWSPYSKVKKVYVK